MPDLLVYAGVKCFRLPDFLSGPGLSTEQEVENFVAGWQSQPVSDLRFEETAERQSAEAEA